MIEEAIAVHPTDRAVDVAQRQDRVILTQNVVVSPRALGIDRSNVSEEEACGVDVVHQHLVDEEAVQLTKIGLLRIRLIAQASADPASEPIGQGSSNIAPANDFGDGPIPGLPAPVVVHHEAHAMAFGNLHHAASSFPVGRHGLLADDRQPSLSRQGDEFQVRGRARDDIDKIQVLGLQHLFGRSVSAPRSSPGSLNRNIARRYDFGIRYAAPRRRVIPGEEPTSDHATLEYRQGSSALPDSRCAGLVHIIWWIWSAEKPELRKRSAYSRRPVVGGGVCGWPRSVESTVVRTPVSIIACSIVWKGTDPQRWVVETKHRSNQTLPNCASSFCCSNG